MRLIESIKNKKILLITPVLALALTVGVVAVQDKPEQRDTTMSVGGDVAPADNIAPAVVNPNTGSSPIKLSVGGNASTHVAPASTQNQVAASEEPVVEDEPEQEQAPPRKLMGKTPRYEEVNAHANLVTKPAPDGYKYMELHCDYAYSDGTSESMFKAIVTRKLPGSSGLEMNISC